MKIIVIIIIIGDNTLTIIAIAPVLAEIILVETKAVIVLIHVQIITTETISITIRVIIHPDQIIMPIKITILDSLGIQMSAQEKIMQTHTVKVITLIKVEILRSSLDME